MNDLRMRQKKWGDGGQLLSLEIKSWGTVWVLLRGSVHVTGGPGLHPHSIKLTKKSLRTANGSVPRVLVVKEQGYESKDLSSGPQHPCKQLSASAHA